MKKTLSWVLALVFGSLLFALVLHKPRAQTEPPKIEVSTGVLMISQISYWVEVTEVGDASVHSDVVAKMWRLENGNHPSFITGVGTIYKGELRWGKIFVMDPENTACGMFSANSAAIICEEVSELAANRAFYPLFNLSPQQRTEAAYLLYEGVRAVMPHPNFN
ncbi:MAG: hypothetical protein NTU97_01235 [Candidatus Magasanikbacteria bacterium]|nr:hypothetical protein [Candidatus Magasanikbacteria bacterium]